MLVSRVGADAHTNKNTNKTVECQQRCDEHSRTENDCWSPILEGFSRALANIGEQERMLQNELCGGPGRTRTCNQTVMSGRISTRFVDFPWFLFDFDRVCFGLFRVFLVRNWCGDETFRGLGIVHQIVALGPANS
jgi:hypothetical protein